MTDTDAATRDRLSGLVDPFVVDVDAHFERIRSRPGRMQKRRWPVATGAMAIAAAGIALLVWSFSRGTHLRPAAMKSNGRLAFVDYAPGYRPPRHGIGGAFADTDIYSMSPDGTGVRHLTSGPGIDFAPSWSADGTRLAFIRGQGDVGPSNVFVASSVGTAARQITTCGTVLCIQDVAWSPGGDWLVYVAHNELRLVRPSGRDNHIISRCLDGCVFHGPSWSPDGLRLVLTAGFPGEDIGELLLMDLGNPLSTDMRTMTAVFPCRLAARICPGARDLDPSWSPDGRWIAFTRVNRLFLVRPDGTGLHRLPGCSAPVVFGRRVNCRAFDPTWSPDGTKIAFDSLPGTFVMNTDGTELKQLRQTGSLGSWQTVFTSSPAPRGPSTTLVFERIASCGPGLCSGDRPAPAIVVANPNGSNVRAIGGGIEPAASPDGTRIAFKGMDGDLYVMDADGNGVTRIFNCRAPDCHGMNDPTWSQDGKRIAFAGAIRRGGGFLREIYTINADGTGLRRVTTCNAPECSELVSPSFSLVGQSIAFEADVRPAGSPVYETLVQSLDLGTGQIQTVYRCTSECSFQGGLDWSPDRRSLVYGLGSGLFVASLDGSPTRQLTTNPQDVFPSWSPDGRMIAFTRYPDRSTGGIYVVDVSTGEVTTTIEGGSRRWSYMFPTWLPG